MRAFALALLLASAAAPAIAAPQDDDRRADRRSDRSEKAKPKVERESRPERAVQVRRESRSEERSVAAPPRNRPTLDRPEQSIEAPRDERPVMERLRDRSRQSRGVATPPSEPEARPSGDSVRDWRWRERRRDDSPSAIEERNLRRAPVVDRPGGDLVQPERPLPRVLDPDRRIRRVSRTPVPGTEPPPPRTASADVSEPRHRWRDDWRRDRRFDWRDHRRRHRSLFHFGIYLDPFGWDYHRYGAGWRLWPSYYSSNYWLRDPWMYRLPPAYGPYRWIRYYDDALLVNIYTGQVVDVIHDFFW